MQAGLVLAGVFACAPSVLAQEALQQQRDQAASEYEKLSSELTVTGDKLKQLEDEVAGLKKDQTTITAALIQSAKTDKKLQQDIADIADKLTALREQKMAFARRCAHGAAFWRRCWPHCSAWG